MKQNIYKMELFDEIEISRNEQFKRVPGGWVYNLYCQSEVDGSWTGNSTFIPFDNEFKKPELGQVPFSAKQGPPVNK